MSIPSTDEYIHDATLGCKMGGNLRQNFSTTGPFISLLGRELLLQLPVCLNPSTQLGSLFRCHAGSVAEWHGLACDRLGENPDTMGAEVLEILEV